MKPSVTAKRNENRNLNEKTRRIKEIKLELLNLATNLLKIPEPDSLKAFSAEIKRLANLL